MSRLPIDEVREEIQTLKDRVTEIELTLQNAGEHLKFGTRRPGSPRSRRYIYRRGGAPPDARDEELRQTMAMVNAPGEPDNVPDERKRAFRELVEQVKAAR